ncbi:hypothetical protein BLOT_013578 [Blomia tropicalis]|nr:hypothetical protein BLOT_013578 [Blomia tropicalis]
MVMMMLVMVVVSETTHTLRCTELWRRCSGNHRSASLMSNAIARRCFFRGSDRAVNEMPLAPLAIFDTDNEDGFQWMDVPIRPETTIVSYTYI